MEEKKPDVSALFEIRRRFRAALAFAGMSADSWAVGAGYTVQHLNAVLRGDPGRAMTDEMKAKLESFISEQFRMMREEETGSLYSNGLEDLVARALEKYIEAEGFIDVSSTDITHEGRDAIALIAKHLAEWLSLLHRQDLEKASLERES